MRQFYQAIHRCMSNSLRVTMRALYLPAWPYYRQKPARLSREVYKFVLHHDGVGKALQPVQSVR